ncbi:unnamed protein product [Lasius platythorax]|uniref:Uncharacterized protein n=1 Tax=Lasius platythorax TaxID=488582 RepID=A0AAV2NX98_9HYME
MERERSVGAKEASHIAAHVKRRLSVHAEAESPRLCIYPSIASHSQDTYSSCPRTRPRVSYRLCVYAARYVSARRYAHRPLRLAMPKRPTGMSADGNLRDGGIEGSSREEFKEQIDRNLS